MSIVIRLALFMNVNTKIPKMKHCPCPKYVMMYRPDLYNLQNKKNLKKCPKVKIHFSDNVTTK